MAARLTALLPRLVALTLLWLLATSTITFAAAGRSTPDPAPAPASQPKGAELLVVPDVRRQAYVFAKGILEDGGFSWRVEGSVKGYAANPVAVQHPAPGVKVVDTGSPTMLVRLERNPGYEERGLPENESPQAGTKLVLASASAKAPAPAAPKKVQPTKKKQPTTKPKKAAPAAQAAPSREAAFAVPGAPSEPLRELALPKRAELLEQKLANREPNPALVQYWLYQHSWIVTGAKFGWSGGAEALRTLIRIDDDLQARWGVGAKSAAVARAALAEVKAKSER
jgi:hypothetical protein